MKIEKSENKGITMIALVITIIILLILAGITIGTLNSNDGLLKKSKKAKEEHEIAQAQELLSTELSSILAGNQGNKNLKDLDNLIVNGYTTNVSDVARLVSMTKENKTYYFLVDSEFNIQNLNNISSQGNNSGNSQNSNLNSEIINDFEIEVSEIESSSLTINTKSDVTTQNGTSIKGWIIFLQNKAIDTTQTLPYKISNLELDTSYSGIYVQAIDEEGKIKKSQNVLNDEKTLNEPIELKPDDYVCSSVWDGYPASKAFDGIESGLNYWHAKDSSFPQYCGAKYNNKVKVTKFYLNCQSYQSKNIVLQGSNDGTNWIDIQSYTCTKMAATYNVTNEYNERYNYYCIKTTSGSYYVSYYEIKFFGYK